LEDRLSRIAAWISFLLIIVYVLTGFAMVGMWNMDSLIGVRRSTYWHTNIYLAYLLLITVLTHSLICIKNTLKKWKVL